MTGERRAAVLGSPIAHSLSPVLHRAAYAALGLSDWRYDAHRVERHELADFVAKLDDSWVGLSLTMPLKHAALRVADSVTDLATAIGAANTLLLGAQGRVADNTDALGMADVLRKFAPQPGPVMIVGAGGTAQAALGALSILDIHSDVTIAVREPARADRARETADRLGLDVAVRRLDALPDLTLAAGLVVSTVPIQGSDALVDLPWSPATVFFDALYAPWPTPAADSVLRRGGTVISGLELLLHQAGHQVRLMTGSDAPLAAMREALTACSVS